MAYRQPTFMSCQENSIIDLFMSNTEFVELSMTIRHDLSLGNEILDLCSFDF